MVYGVYDATFTFTVVKTQALLQFRTDFVVGQSRNGFDRLFQCLAKRALTVTITKPDIARIIIARC